MTKIETYYNNCYISIIVIIHRPKYNFQTPTYILILNYLYTIYILIKIFENTNIIMTLAWLLFIK